jgi:hypothetical protein
MCILSIWWDTFTSPLRHTMLYWTPLSIHIRVRLSWYQFPFVCVVSVRESRHAVSRFSWNNILMISVSFHLCCECTWITSRCVSFFLKQYITVFVCACACMRLCVRSCVCMRACARLCVCVCVYTVCVCACVSACLTLSFDKKCFFYLLHFKRETWKLKWASN